MMHDRNVREVHELDVSSARAQIRAGCETASAAWIPSDAIADALLLECVDFTTRLTTQQHLIERLEHLVSVLKKAENAATLQ